MINRYRASYWDIAGALVAFGYQTQQHGSNMAFKHPCGTQLIILPIDRPSELASETHLKIAETAVREDGAVAMNDFRFYLENRKTPQESIRRGDKLIWIEPTTGKKVTVTAAAGEKDGIVVIKQKGTMAPYPVEQLSKVS